MPMEILCHSRDLNRIFVVFRAETTKRTTSFASLHVDAGLHALLPYLVKWVGEGVVGALQEERMVNPERCNALPHCAKVLRRLRGLDRTPTTSHCGGAHHFHALPALVIFLLPPDERATSHFGIVRAMVEYALSSIISTNLSDEPLFAVLTGYKAKADVARSPRHETRSSHVSRGSCPSCGRKYVSGLLSLQTEWTTYSNDPNYDSSHPGILAEILRIR
ncbi:hypothetical protein BKA83DRAFT_4344028, partial [Pisolithus microcarpus]